MEDTFVFCKACDEHGFIRFTLVNRALANAFRKEYSDIIGKTDRELGLPAEQVAKFARDDSSILIGGPLGVRKDRLIVTETVTTYDGKRRQFRTAKQAVLLPDGTRQLFGVATQTRA